MQNKFWAGWPQRLMVVAGIVLLASGVVQAAVPWVPPSGTNAAFGYSLGQNTTGKFGNPTVSVLGFSFLNMNNFRATVGAGATDIMSVTVNVATPNPDGPPIHIITIREWGTWSVGVSAPTDFATCAAAFQLYRYVPEPTEEDGFTDIFHLPVFNFRDDGTWYSSRQLIAGTPGNGPNADVDWLKVKITMQNTLQVIDPAPLGSFIQKTGMTVVLPEPGSALLMFLGGLVPLALRSRRR